MKKALILGVMIVFSLFVVSSAYAAKIKSECPQPRKTKKAPGAISKKDRTGKANLANGKKIYLKTAKPMACKMCHGKKGDGSGKLGKALKPRPRNFTCAAPIETSGFISTFAFWFTVQRQ